MYIYGNYYNLFLINYARTTSFYALCSKIIDCYYITNIIINIELIIKVYNDISNFNY